MRPSWSHRTHLPDWALRPGFPFRPFAHAHHPRRARFLARETGLRRRRGCARVPHAAAPRHDVAELVGPAVLEHPAVDLRRHPERPERLDLLAAHELQRERPLAVEFDLDVIEAEAVAPV